MPSDPARSGNDLGGAVIYRCDMKLFCTVALLVAGCANPPPYDPETTPRRDPVEDPPNEGGRKLTSEEAAMQRPVVLVDHGIFCGDTRDGIECFLDEKQCTEDASSCRTSDSAACFGFIFNLRNEQMVSCWSTITSCESLRRGFAVNADVRNVDERCAVVRTKK